MKRNFWNRALGLLALVLIGWLLISLRGKRPEPASVKTSVPEGVVTSETMDVEPASGVIKSKWADLRDAQKADFENKFESRLKPAISAWCRIYGDHVPFSPDAITADNLFGEIGRGNRQVYTFILSGITFAVQDFDGSAQVMYLNSPESKKLMELPTGATPNPNTSISRDEVSELLKLDSGTNFSPAEIRIIPTAFSSAMNGGANVNAGGDPNNAASWKFTLVFGPDGHLNYYMRGH